MNKYEGLCCPVCHGKLFEDDDIAVCPVCGAPHHRDCYKFEGHCHFEDKHNTDEQWEMPETVKKQDESEADTIKCRYCGEQMSKSNLFCPKCGMAVNGAAQQPPFAMPNNPQFNAGFGYDKNEKIDGVTAQEIATFVGYNNLRYINIFRRMALAKSKTGWNWIAFLMPEYWFFARKCYKAGILTSFLTILYSVLLTIVGFSTQTLTQMMYGETSATDAAALLQSPEMIAVFVLSVVSIVIRILIGTFGDYIYKRKVYGTLASLKEQGLIEPFAIAQAGGVNLFIPVIAYFLINMAVLFIGLFIS